MAFGFNTGGTNWNIDYSNNRAGEIAAQGMIAGSGVLANSIVNAAKEFGAAKKKKEEEAQAFEGFKSLASRMGMNFADEKDAKGTFKAMGGAEGLMEYARLQADQDRLKQQSAQAMQIATLATQKAQRETTASNAIIEAATAANIPEGEYLAGPTGKVTPFGSKGLDTNRFVQIAMSKGADTNDVLEFARAMGAVNKAETPTFTPQLVNLSDGKGGTVRTVKTSPNSAQVIPDEKVEVLRNGARRKFGDVEAELIGNEWMDTKTGAPLYIAQRDDWGKETGRVKNPDVWGAPPAPVSPIRDGASPVTAPDGTPVKPESATEDEAAIMWINDPANVLHPHLQRVKNTLRRKGLIR